jgi:hypothetical protein
MVFSLGAGILLQQGNFPATESMPGRNLRFEGIGGVMEAGSFGYPQNPGLKIHDFP